MKRKSTESSQAKPKKAAKMEGKASIELEMVDLFSPADEEECEEEQQASCEGEESEEASQAGDAAEDGDGSGEDPSEGDEHDEQQAAAAPGAETHWMPGMSGDEGIDDVEEKPVPPENPKKDGLQESVATPTKTATKGRADKGVPVASCIRHISCRMCTQSSKKVEWGKRQLMQNGEVQPVGLWCWLCNTVKDSEPGMDDAQFVDAYDKNPEFRSKCASARAAAAAARSSPPDIRAFISEAKRTSLFIRTEV
jgi:hypothetical protein